jgi:Tfp pilus assembly protein PilO
MILAKRERYIAIITLVTLAILIVDRYLLTPYFDHHARLVVEKQVLADDLARAHNLFTHRKEVSSQWEKMMQSGLKSDAASAENAVLNALGNWAQESGVTLVSLTPERGNQRGQMREITFQAVCAGPMSAIGNFLLRVETTALPVKISDLQLTANKEGSDDLALQVRVAALYLSQASGEPSGAAVVSETAVAREGQQ